MMREKPHSIRPGDRFKYKGKWVVVTAVENEQYVLVAPGRQFSVRKSDLKAD